MSAQSHLAELQRKHQALDTEIATKQKSPGVNDLDLQTLKKRKLRIKEQIEKTRALVS